MSTPAQLRGYLLEEALAWLLRHSGYRLLVDQSQDPDELILSGNGLPAWAGTVRLEHLPYHTGGMQDVQVDAVIGQTADRTSAAVLSALAEISVLAAAPGTGHSYSSARYVCLAAVVERAAGQPLPEFAARPTDLPPLGQEQHPLLARSGARAARRRPAESPGPGVGAVGLCFTGNFALAMTLEPAVIAPVVNHPSLPLDDPAGLELSDADARAVANRVARDGLTVLAYRFDNDRWCTGQRFAAYQALLGDAFDGRVLPGQAANPEPPPFFRDIVGCPHSFVTAHLVDERSASVKSRQDAYRCSGRLASALTIT